MMLSQGKLLRNVLILNMDKQLEDISATMYEEKIENLDNEQLYVVVIFMVKSLIETFVKSLGEKTFYYISNQFSKGGFLENNLTNLGIGDILDGVLASKGKELADLKRVEENYVGKQISFQQTSYNFFEESSKHNLPAQALGIRYIQEFEDKGKEVNNYIKEKSWLEKKDVFFEAALDEVTCKFLCYDMDVVGNDKEMYKFHLFDLKIENEICENDKQIFYDYFLAYGSIKEILYQMRSNQYDLRKMDTYARIGMEGKYMAFVIPELIRVMVDEKAIPIEEAIDVVRKTCGYKDYSTMCLALEQCPNAYVEKLVPHLIEKIKGME